MSYVKFLKHLKNIVCIANAISYMQKAHENNIVYVAAIICYMQIHMKIAWNSSYGLKFITWLQNLRSGLPFGVRLLMALKLGSFLPVGPKFVPF